MLSGFGTALIENNGYSVRELYTTVTPQTSAHWGPQTFTRWGYIVSKPDNSFSVFPDKISALQHVERCLNDDWDGTENEFASEQKVFRQDVISSPSLPSFMTAN